MASRFCLNSLLGTVSRGVDKPSSLNTGRVGGRILIEMRKPSWRPAGLGALLLMSVAPSAVATSPPGGPPPLMALGGLERGLWELRERGVGQRDSAPVTRLCVRNPFELMQIRHRDGRCRHFVIADEPGRSVITYECPHSGTGRTDLRVETSRLVRIDAQGVADGAPFFLSLEGRRVGDCR